MSKYLDKKERKIEMDALNIPIVMRSAFIRFANRGVGEFPQGHFWRNRRWGEYAPVEDRSRVYRTMKEMWEMYQKHFS